MQTYSHRAFLQNIAAYFFNVHAFAQPGKAAYTNAYASLPNTFLPLFAVTFTFYLRPKYSSIYTMYKPTFIYTVLTTNTKVLFRQCIEWPYAPAKSV